ncbi:MAG: hypothetical protein ABSF67_14140 [Roseiarcus sp.]|jgi:hypothetical protein
MATPRRKTTAAAFIAAPILFVIAVGVAGLSARALALSAANADLLDLAASIEKQAQPDADYLARFIASKGLDRASVDCGDSFTRASLTVNLAVLDAATKTLDAPLVDAAEKSAIRAAAHRLACNPLDGNAWLRYAEVENKSAGRAETVTDALRASYWTAPSEGWIIESRLPFATDLVLTGASGFETEYIDDLRRFASFESSGRVAAAYVALSPPVRHRLRPLIDGEPETQKKAILAAIDRLGVDYQRDAP